MAEDRFRLRFKGTISGPFVLSTILEKLAAHELSLAHCIESQGRWLTLRAYLRSLQSTEATYPGPTLLEGPSAPPPPPGSQTTAVLLERLTQRAYLWCGLTFGLPFVAVGLFWLIAPGLNFKAYDFPFAYSLLIFVLGVGSTAMAWNQARHAISTLNREGLSDVGASARQLANSLSLASGLLWLLVAVLFY